MSSINELTFNELSAADFLPNDWGSINIGDYTRPGYSVYSDDEEVCFKLAVWILQCKFSNLVKKYIDNLSYGIKKEKELDCLKEFMRGLQVLNNYNPRDILNNTTNYNVLSYSTILDILQVLNKKYS